MHNDIFLELNRRIDDLIAHLKCGLLVVDLRIHSRLPLAMICAIHLLIAVTAGVVALVVVNGAGMHVVGTDAHHGNQAVRADDE